MLHARGQSTAELQQQHVDRLHRHTIHTTSADMAHANGPSARATVNSTSWWRGQEQRVVLNFVDADTTQKATGATSAQIDFSVRLQKLLPELRAMSSDVAKCDQVVFECMQKVAEVIVSSRVLHQRPKTGRSINSKFSLHIEELAFVRHSMEAWKADLHLPLGVDIFWQEYWQGDSAQHSELLERWEIAYELQDSVESKSAQLRHLYKRAIILLRTLYSFVRMMPAYQVYRRIQNAYDSRDRSVVDMRDDLGFCLYPILDSGGGGSGLDFGEIPRQGDQQHETESRRDSSICSFSFKPLETPHGTVLVKVTYRKGTNSKALQQGHTMDSPPSVTPNMTSSIIQDYVPDEYDNDQLRQDLQDSKGIIARGAEGEVHLDYRPRLATTPEDATMASRSPIDGNQQGGRVGQHVDEHGMISRLGALLQHDIDPSIPGATIGTNNRSSFDPSRSRSRDAYNMGEVDLEPGPDVLNWPSPQQGHGYAAKRVANLTGQGPAPFLTPGPHRHKLVPSRRQRMEPLDLGPTADVCEREPRQTAAPMLQTAGHTRSLTRDSGDCYDSGRRDSSDDSSTGGVHTRSRSLNTQGSFKGYASREGDAVLLHDDFQNQTTQRADTDTGQGMLVYGMRNSIGHHRSTLLHCGAPESTPPFSYCEESVPARTMDTEGGGSPFRLSQPLVTFSPPFYADPDENRTIGEVSAHDGGKGDTPPPPQPDTSQHPYGPNARYSAPRTSLVALSASSSLALLETLPESPFAGRAQGQPNSAVGKGISTAAGLSTAFLTPPAVHRRNEASHVSNQSSARATFGESEALPFSTEMPDDGFEALAQDRRGIGSERGTNDPKGTLFPSYSGVNSKSVILMKQGSQRQDTEEAQQPLALASNAAAAYVETEGSAYARVTGKHLAGEAEKTVRTLEEELDGFRQFHQELERQGP